MWGRRDGASGIWGLDASGLRRLVTVGDTPIGAPIGGLDDHELTNPARDVLFLDAIGLVKRADAGTMTRVLSIDDPVPGRPAFTITAIVSYFLDETGGVTALLSGQDGAAMTKQFIVRGDAGNFSLLAASNEMADGTEGGDYHAFEIMGVSPEGIVIFSASIDPPNVTDPTFWGIWKADPQATASRIVRGPIPLGTAMDIGKPEGRRASVARQGRFAFSSSFVGVLVSSGGGLAPLVTNQTQLGTETMTQFSNVVINDRGDVAFDVDLSGPIATDKATLLYLAMGAELQQTVVARKGDVVQLDDARMVTISACGIMGDAGRGGARSLSDSGALVYGIGYTDAMGPQQAVLVTQSTTAADVAVVTIEAFQPSFAGELFYLVPVTVTLTNSLDDPAPNMRFDVQVAGASGEVRITNPDDAACSDPANPGCTVSFAPGETIMKTFFLEYELKLVGETVTITATLETPDADPANDSASIRHTFEGVETDDDDDGGCCASSRRRLPLAGMAMWIAVAIVVLRRRRRR
jgi:hypothetical protein